MDIRVNDIISVKHYSYIRPLKSIIIGRNDDVISIRLVKEFSVFNFLEGDPLVIAHEENSNINIIGSTIETIDLVSNSLDVCIDHIDTEAQKRSYERFPVSLYADIKTATEKKKHLSVIKDMSHFGLQISSKSELAEKSIVSVDIYTEEKVISITAQVMRKEKFEKYYAYGLTIQYDNVVTMSYMKEYMEMLKKEQADSIIKMKNYD